MSTIIFVWSPSLEDDSDKLRQFHIRGKESIVSTIIFVRSPSLEDDSDERRNLKPNNSPCFETKATNLNTTHFYITFYKKIGLFLYLDNLEQSVVSYRGRTKVKISTDTLIGNLRNMRNMHFNITFDKKLASSCIWIIWNKPWRPTEDELKLKSLVIT